MVRLGGLDYRCDPLAAMGSRIDEMRLDNGTVIEASKIYRVAGWATVGSRSNGDNIWDIVAQHLREQQEVKIGKLNTPVLVNVAGNPGYEA